MIIHKTLVSSFLVTLILTQTIAATIHLPKNLALNDIARSAQKELAIATHKVVGTRSLQAKWLAYFKGSPTYLKEGIVLQFQKLWFKLGGKKGKNVILSEESNTLPEHISGEAYVSLFNKHGKQNLSTLVEAASNTNMPTPGMESLLKDIAKNGYSVRILSNIGPKILDLMINKFKTTGSSIFDIAKDGVIVDYGAIEKPSALVAAYVLSQQPMPQAAMFQQYLTTYNTGNKKYVVFVDSSLEIINAAIEQGMIGIHFTTVDELKKDLITLEFLKA